MGSTQVDKARILATKCRKMAEIATAVKETVEFLRNLSSAQIDQLSHGKKICVEADEACTKLYNDLSRPEQEETSAIIRQIAKLRNLEVVFNSSSMKLTVSDPTFNNDDSNISFEEEEKESVRVAAGS